MATSDPDKLRAMLGERIPEGGTFFDTLFTDEQIMELISEAGGNLERAAYEGWRVKLAEFANLVDVTDATAQRKMSDLRENAEAMVKLYQRASGGSTEGRTRVGRIVRGG